MSNETEFTRCVLKESDTEVIVEEGEWFDMEIKPMFDLSILRFGSLDHEALLGFRLSRDVFTLIRQRLGYFNSQVNKILHRILRHMRLGETSQISFEIDPDLLNEAFAKNEQNSNKVYLDLKFEINLIEIEKFTDKQIQQAQIYSLNEKELLELLNEHKKDANDLYKKSFYLSGFHRYQKSMNYLLICENLVKEKLKKENLKTIDEEDDKHDQEKNGNQNFLNNLLQIKSQLYSNMAACQLKNNNYPMAKINCTNCLNIKPENVKALYRRAQAFTMLNDYDEAIQDLNTAGALEPNNSDIKQRLSLVENLQRNYKNKMSANLKKMFS